MFPAGRAVETAMKTRTPHPHFDDRGVLDWHVRWRDAQAAARAEKKLVFVELGREACGQCRTLVQAVLPRPDVAPLLQQHFVALAADADECEEEVQALAEHLADAEMLPFVLCSDAEGRFLAGYSGVVTPAKLLEMLQKLVAGRS